MSMQESRQRVNDGHTMVDIKTKHYGFFRCSARMYERDGRFGVLAEVSDPKTGGMRKANEIRVELSAGGVNRWPAVHPERDGRMHIKKATHLDLYGWHGKHITHRYVNASARFFLPERREVRINGLTMENRHPSR